ncbi:hypothetical protein C8A03DRAFT_36110 [Achaetomium macrosporum]|uniref:Uncharacterized protein n=1 Tax=Achaetomium macrosporum TaxID=79813 RepID=A0AAN7C689_9PEZI|nr:hypothetical protein C8A03DRAFT_36110 [Achaetomium macrosporum]
MTGSQGLLPETVRVEAKYTELNTKLAELQHQYDVQERQAMATFSAELKAIDADFEKQSADIAAQLGSMPEAVEKVEKVLREKKDLEIEALRRKHVEETSARRARYHEQKTRYKEEYYTIITSLMDAAPGPKLGHPSAVSVSRLGEKVIEASRAGPGPSQTDLVDAAPAAPPVTDDPTNGIRRDRYVALPRTLGEANDKSSDNINHSLTEVASQPREVAFLLPSQTSNKPDKQIPLTQSNVPFDGESRWPRSLSPHNQATPTESAPLQRTDDGNSVERDPRVQAAEGPLDGPESITPAQEPPRLESVMSFGGHEHKRKADGPSNGESSASPLNRVKRARLKKADDGEGGAPDQLSPREAPGTQERTVSFEDVYGKPGNRPQHRHIIVQYPSGSGKFYILRCDEHGVHFGEHPLRGAAKHLASAQHGYMSKAHATAIETLGHRVLGCTQELADENNRDVLRGFKDGTYKIFNANNLSQAKRAELGFAPLDTGTPKVARKPSTVITDPIPCRFYVSSVGEQKCPVLILPWGDTSPAGLHGTLASTGLFDNPTGDGRQLGVPKLPKCYIYDEEDGHVKGILGWARGYEAGGPFEKRREFPVLCAENADYRFWSVGWVKAAHLSPFDFDHPGSRNIPFFEAARDYFVTKILPQRGVRDAMHATAEDVEMRDVGAMNNNDSEGYSDQDSISKATTDADSRRTSLSNRDESVGELKSLEGASFRPAMPGPSATPISPATNARLIAAQALNLQTPPRSAFTPINAASGPGTSASRSASASVDPPSRAGSVSSTSGGHRRVLKIHARSRNPHTPNQSHSGNPPPVILPERPMSGAPSHSGTLIQLQGIERKASPASLQNILQEFSEPGPVGPPQLASQSPKPAGARRPLPSAPMRAASPSVAASSSFTVPKQPQLAREIRAGSAPVQSPQQQRDSAAEEIRRAESATAATPGSSRHPTPQPPAPLAAARDPEAEPEVEVAKDGERRPHAIQLPPPPNTWSQIPQLSTTPLATPTASAANTRSNSPVLPLPKIAAPTPGFTKPETPILTPTSGFVPTMDVFDVAGFMEDGKEIFRSGASGQFLRVIDDHQSGILTTPPDAPVSLMVEPRKIKSVTRVPSQGGLVCVVKLTYHAEKAEGRSDGEGERTQTLVLEKARSTSSGMQNGVVHARRFCRRLLEWNPDILNPAVSNL